MRALLAVLLLPLGLLLPGYSFALEQFQTEQAAQKHCLSDTVAWLNTSSGVLHYRGQHWYGLTKKGAYVCKKEAAAESGRKPAASAVTGWTVVSKMSMSGGNAILYADLATIQNKDSVARMGSLVDFESEQETQGVRFLSSKLNKEYDCKKEQWRIFSSSVFSKNMGGGQIVQSDNDPDEWKPVEHGSLAKTEWEIACGKK